MFRKALRVVKKKALTPTTISAPIAIAMIE